jgi:pyridoxamine 5'-phosphate oxidase
MSDFEVPAALSSSLADMRVRYVPDPLQEHRMAPSPWDQFGQWLDEAKAAGLVEPNAMVLSTVGSRGRPTSRHVLLKELDDRGFVFYTNLRSRKAVQISEQPHVALCFPWFAMARQVCVDGSVEQVDRTTAAAYWAVRPRESQLGAWASDQSQPLASRAVLMQQLERASQQFPEGTPVPLPDFWGGYRVLPDTIEFWQGQPGRLHDRLVYRRSESRWALARLQP